MTIAPMGDLALRFDVPAVARRALLSDLSALPGVTDVVLAEELGCVVFDAPGRADTIARELAQRLAVPSAHEAERAPGASRTIRVVYDGEDLAEVAAAAGLDVETLVALHAEREYEVAMMGFLPGFAYLRGLDRRLVLPRRDRPRPRVRAGSVAIGAQYTGVYPFASPGGWHLLGRAVGFTAFDATGATLALGDRVRFERVAPASAEPAPDRAARAPRDLGRPHLEVSAARGIAIVVDGGRPGHMHEGVPHGGPLVPAALARANAACGNPASAAAIELAGTLTLTARGGELVVADDEGGARRLERDASFTVSTAGRARARYVAVEGGLDVPRVLGGRGTLLTAGLGGLDGRPLRRGDALCPEPRAHAAPSSGVEGPSSDEEAIAIMPGPDLVDTPAYSEIVAATFRVSPASDRTGTRLEGPALSERAASATRASAPMVRGAIELTPSGLIVLGPDHPTTGGYPVVAVVRSDALGALFRKPIGASVRFTTA